MKPFSYQVPTLGSRSLKINSLLSLRGLKPVLRNQATLLMYEEALSL